MDIEHIARDWLRSKGFVCEYYVSDPIPEALVTIKRTARNGQTRFMGRAMLTVQAWAVSRGKAQTLCSDAISALVGRDKFAAYGGLKAADANITSCSPENGPYRWDDPDIKDRSRWQATVSVDYNE